MARQNVGTPKFYVDYIQYWQSMGMIYGFGPYAEHSPSDAAMQAETGIHWLLDTKVDGGTAYRPQLIGLDPSNYMDQMRYPYDHNNGLRLHTVLLLNQRTFLPNSGKSWYGYLNHNLGDIGCYHLMLQVYKTMAEYGVDIAATPGDSTSSTYWKGHGISDSSVESEVINFGDRVSIDYNGFSIMEINNPTGFQAVNEFDNTLPDHANAGLWSGGVPWGEGFDILIGTLQLNQTDTDWVALGSNPVRVMMGSMNFGAVYEMPHSPDLKLSMEREYDGISTQQTKGGSTLSNINYSGPPNWRSDLPAWGLTKTYSGGGLGEAASKVKPSSRGRRVWNLKFSYVGSDDLLALNENYTKNNPSDSWIDSSNAGYSSDDFNNGEFETNIDSDSSFFGIVMHKTLGGKLPFIFQPDGNNNSPDQFAICTIDQNSVSFKQVANNVYDVSLKIRETW